MKTIKPGQLVTVDNVVYRCRKTNCKDPSNTCNTCDLYRNCMPLPFDCDMYTNFKRVYPKVTKLNHYDKRTSNKTS